MSHTLHLSSSLTLALISDRGLTDEMMKPSVWRSRSLARPVSVRVVKCLCRRWRFGSESAWPFSSRFLSPLWQQRGSDYIYLLASPRLPRLLSCDVGRASEAEGRADGRDGGHSPQVLRSDGGPRQLSNCRVRQSECDANFRDSDQISSTSPDGERTCSSCTRVEATSDSAANKSGAPLHSFGWSHVEAPEAEGHLSRRLRRRRRRGEQT